MIVADTNVLVYLQIDCPFTYHAAAAYDRDASWHVPLLWRSEFRNVLVQYIRQGTMSVAEAVETFENAQEAIDAEYGADTALVLQLAKDSGCTAYDCEFVALARKLGIRLVTSDRRLAAAFPEDACLLADFAAGK